MRLAATNPMTRVLSAILAFEAVVFGLAWPGMIVVSARPPLVAGLACGGAIVLALAAAALLRRPVGFPLGWLTQVVALALGFGTEFMFAMGFVFVLLWTVTFVLGRRLADR